tara:strand:+ start:887 stop:1363 length:477 start_codon:yes stop_codon:yes gene_type:complete
MNESILKWWLITCLSFLGMIVLFYYDIHLEVYQSDKTLLSFLLVFIFLFTTAWIGAKQFKFNKNPYHMIDTDVGWFISETCLTIGMIGTVTGFLLMLSTTFAGIDITDTKTIQDALVNMAIGMSTALYTTLTGLIVSVIIKIQLVNFEKYMQNTIDEK